MNDTSASRAPASLRRDMPLLRPAIASAVVAAIATVAVVAAAPRLPAWTLAAIPALAAIGAFWASAGDFLRRDSAEQRTLREALERALDEQARLALVARRTTNAVIITDLERRIVWVNEGFTRITGYALAEVVGRVPGSFLQCPETSPETIRRMREALGRHEGCRVEIRNLAKDGRGYWLDIEIQPLRDAAGTVTGFMAIESDITSAVLARKEIEQSERRQKLIVAGADLGTWDWNIATGEVTFNERWCSMLGYRQDEVEPHIRAWEAVLHPEDAAVTTAALQAHFTGRSDIYRCEHRLRTKDGRTIWVLDAGRVYERDAAGRPLRMAGIHLDVTERRAVESAHAALAAIVENSRDAIVGLDLAGKVTVSNDAARAMFGGSCEVGSDGEAWMPHIERPREREARIRVAASGEPEQHESSRILSNGRCIEVSVGLSPVRDESGAVIGVARIERDISDRREKRELASLAEILARQNRRLEEMSERAHRFVDDVSHEFRTPLTVIREFTSLVAEGIGGPVSDQQAEWLQIVDVATGDLNRMVEDFLDSSKLRAGRLRVDRRPTRVEGIVAGVLRMVERKAAARGIQIVDFIEPGLPEVFVDEEKVRRVALNLLANALKFSPDGGIVRFAVRVLDGDVEFSVRDEGPGLSASDLSQLFERFTQLPNAIGPSVKGFGLGLNIARQLVWLNLGRITVSSTLGHGATFAFTVPVAKIETVVTRFMDRLHERKSEFERGDTDRMLGMMRIVPALGASREEVRRLAVASTRPSDLVLESRDGMDLVIVGPTSSMETWADRLSAGVNARRDLDAARHVVVPVGSCPLPCDRAHCEVEILSQLGYPRAAAESAATRRAPVAAPQQAEVARA